MRWSSGISRLHATEAAVNEAAESARAQLGGEEPDLVLLFATPHHQAQYTELPLRIAAHFPRALLLGCSGFGVVGQRVEVEREAGLSLTVAHLPGVDLRPFHVDDADVPEPEVAAQQWRQRLGLPMRVDVSTPAEATPVVVLPEPFSLRIERLLKSLDAAFPRSVKVGGAASGGTRPGSHALWMGPQVFTKGAVGVAMRGNLVVDTVVAQGCKPIGAPLLVTKAHGNVILEVDGKSPLDALKAVAAELSQDDLALVRRALLMGVEVEPDRVDYGTGDFLVRQIAEMDQKHGWLSIGAPIQAWQVVQFHVRDGKTSADDLRRMLVRYCQKQGDGTPHGALIFSCLGRGAGLYGKPNHDSEVFDSLLPGVPLGGFFCNGEIGKAGKNTALHGFTSSFGLFRDPSDVAHPTEDPQWQVRDVAEA